MPLFNYVAITNESKRVKGRLISDSKIDLKNTLAKENLTLINCSIVKEERKNTFFSISSKVKRSEVTSFARQLSIMVQANLSLVDALTILKEQKFSPTFKNIIAELREDVIKGIRLSDSMSKHKKVFPPYFVSMVDIGEDSSSLPKILTNCSEYFAKEEKNKNKTKNALMYPSILMILVVLVIIMLMAFIIPQFEEMFKEMGGELPLLTQIVVNISHFFTDYIFIIIPLLSLTVLGFFFFFKKSRTGKLIKDKIKLSLPIVKNVTIDSLSTRFAASFSILVGSGMTLIDVLSSLKKIINNSIVDERFNKAIEEVEQGKRISRSIERMDVFPKMLIEMLNVGEQSGTLEETMKQASDYYEDRLSSSLSRLTASIEPIIIIIMGLLIGIIILAILLPMISILDLI